MHYLKNLVPQSIKNIYHLAQAMVANVWFGFPASRRRAVVSASRGGPSKKLNVIGITGTNGKTTTVQMTAKILEEAGHKVAMASTINFKINGDEKTNLSHFTTLSAFAVQKFARQAVEAGCEYLVLETSSHSLDQYRVWGINYQTAVITNVTREHLDYHRTMEKYHDAKKILFKMVAKNSGTIIVNLDMEKPDYFLHFDADKKFGYTTKSHQSSDSSNQKNTDTQIVKAENVELGIDYSKFKIKNSEFTLKMPGIFNVENALAATCVGLGEGIGLETIKAALEKITGVPGRLDAVANELGAHIIVDYAVTPDSLEKLYAFLASTKKPDARIIAVFGSCGERDKGKRPLMGEIVSGYADQIILTNEEPYHENPVTIIEDIEKGIKNKKENESYWKIIDRREAIRKALILAHAEDIVVVTGMGAQESMVVGNQKIPWNDKQVIKDELAKIKNAGLENPRQAAK